MTIREVLRYTKGNLINLIEFLRRGKHVSTSEKILFVDISVNHWHRYMQILLMFFELSGYRIVLKYRFGFFGHWGTNPIIKHIKNLVVVFGNDRATEASIVLCDDLNKYPNSNALKVSYDYFKTAEVRDLKIPMCCVDSWYKFDLGTRADQNKKRRLSITFVGNSSKEHYDHGLIKEEFGLVNRYLLLKKIRQDLKVFIPSNIKELFCASVKGLTVVDRRGGFNVPAKQYAELLHETNFFLCPPGVVMPQSHNVIEAMAHGAIPVLEYGHEMVPPLKHGVNCISFSGADDCVMKLREIENLTEIEIQELRGNVINYYNTYLTVSAVVKSIEQAVKSNVNTLLLNAEYPSVIKKKQK